MEPVESYRKLCLKQQTELCRIMLVLNHHCRDAIIRLPGSSGISPAAKT